MYPIGVTQPKSNGSRNETKTQLEPKHKKLTGKVLVGASLEQKNGQLVAMMDSEVASEGKMTRTELEVG